MLIHLTELNMFNVLKPQRAAGLATIMRQAELHELRVGHVRAAPRAPRRIIPSRVMLARSPGGPATMRGTSRDPAFTSG